MLVKKKVLLVDDHSFVREWLSTVIGDEPELEVCGTAGTAREALQLLQSVQPDVAIVDIWLEHGSSGLELLKDIKALRPNIKTIIFSMHDELAYAERAMRAGACGYVMKRDATGKILDAIKTVLLGKTFFSQSVNEMMAQKLAHGASAGEHSSVAVLSDRELEVYELLGCGRNTREISTQLNLSAKTIQVYCARIKEKLNLSNINELVANAAHWHAGRLSG